MNKLPVSNVICSVAHDHYCTCPSCKHKLATSCTDNPQVLEPCSCCTVEIIEVENSR